MKYLPIVFVLMTPIVATADHGHRDDADYRYWSKMEREALKDAHKREHEALKERQKYEREQMKWAEKQAKEYEKNLRRLHHEQEKRRRHRRDDYRHDRYPLIDSVAFAYRSKALPIEVIATLRQ